MPISKATSRHVEILLMRHRLERLSLPRAQMTLIVAITGGVGFLSSYVSLSLGMTHMGWRYGLAFAIAYLAFLGLLWLWMRTQAEDYVDGAGDLIAGIPTPSSGSPECTVAGQGGEFGGGGAQGNFSQALEPPSLNLPTGRSSDGLFPDLGDATADVDEQAIPIAILLVALALVFSSFYVVYAAPLLFAELLVDGVLAASLYHRLRGLETPHWLETALRRTFLPFLLTGLLVTGCGWWMEGHFPEAVSIGDVWRNR